MCFIWLCVLDYRGRGGENIRIRDTSLGGRVPAMWGVTPRGSSRPSQCWQLTALGWRRVFSQPPFEGSGLQLGFYSDERVPRIKLRIHFLDYRLNFSRCERWHPMPSSPIMGLMWEPRTLREGEAGAGTSEVNRPLPRFNVSSIRLLCNRTGESWPQ